MSATITLAKPIQAHGETITALVFRDPCARDLKEFRIGDATVGNWLPLIASLAGIPPSSVESMCPADVLAAIDVVAPLLLPPPSTGAT
jgi:Phage tail assembly chaperone proteins, E, or 41 or 14